MSDAQPVAAGEMATTGLGELLYSLYERKATGSIVLAENEQTLHCVRLMSGLVQKVRLAEAFDPVGALLVEQGSLDQGQLQEVLGVATAGGTLFGQTAVHMGVLARDDLRRALAEQVFRRTSRLFALTTGTYGFYVEDFLATYGGPDSPPVDPVPIIASGVRGYYDLGRLTRLLHPVASAWLRVARGSTVVGRFRFTKEEASVASALSEPRTLEELARTTNQPLTTVRVVAYCLLSVGALEASAQAPVAAPAAVAPSGGGGATAIDPGDKRAVAEDLIARHKEMNLFELLGIAPGASDGEIQKAYVERARHFHPDRARGDLADLKAGLAEFFAQVTVARQTLMEPAARAKYMKKHGLAPPAPEASPEPATASPEPPSGPKSEARLELEALLDGFEEMTYFELLGIEQGCQDSEIQRAYVDRVRKFHPDRIPRDLADLKGRVADLFGRITQAHKTLKDPASRREYEKSLGLGGDAHEEELVQAILDAETSFMKAKILLKTNRLEEAEQLARSAAEAEPEAGQYAGLLVWIESRRRPRGKDVSDLVERLKEATKTAPMSEDNHFYLAELLNVSGRKTEAFREYQEAVDLNPHNIDAVRMVRHLRRSLEEDKKKKQKPTGLIMGFLMKDVRKK